MPSSDFLKEFNLTEKQLEDLKKYMLLLQEWNEKIDLTNIIEDDEVYIKHYFDSLILGKYLNDSIKIADIGTGAGFPGLPLKIYNSSLNMDLIEPTNKRCRFLQDVIDNLKLQDINIINERSENLTDSREYYDVVCSRAVARLSILLELSIPLLKVKGKMYALKGSSFKEELDDAKHALKELKCKVTNIYEYDLPLDMGHHAIIEIEKLEKTNIKYPRVYAKIKKQPL